MTFIGLSPEQRATIGDLSKMKLELGFVGVDARDRPVVWINDQWRTFMMGVRRDGAGRDAIEPLRWLADDEVEAMNVPDSELLFSLPIKQPTQEVWHDEAKQVHRSNGSDSGS